MTAAPCVVAIGADGCRGGWVAAACHQGPGVRWTSLRVAAGVEELAFLQEQSGASPPVAIDVPIGLPESVELRRCDREARRLLGPRWPSVFVPPGRDLLEASTPAEARDRVEARRRRDPEAKGISAQALGILPKIRQVDRFIRSCAGAPDWLVEAHPEVSFRAWAGRDLPTKRSAAGELERLAVVRGAFADVEQVVRGQAWRRSEVGLIDVLDAYAALWTALRFRAGRHRVLGGERLDGVEARIVV